MSLPLPGSIYCTARLHRLRKGKGLKMLQGRRTFEKKDVQADKVTDVRCGVGGAAHACGALWVPVAACESRLLAVSPGWLAVSPALGGHGVAAAHVWELVPNDGLWLAAPRVSGPVCRHLLIPLFQAERSWAYAMDLKQVCVWGGGGCTLECGCVWTEVCR